MRHARIWLITALASATIPLSAGGQEPVFDQTLDSLLNLTVSTVAKYEQTRAQAPASITIVTADEIERFGYRSLHEVFQQMPGFYVTSDRTYSAVGVRGFGRPGDFNNRLLVLVDGHAINDGISGGARTGTALNLDLEDLDRIEIVRGPGSSLYGARAMLAVVNLVTKRGRATDGVEARGEVGNLSSRRGFARIGTTLGNDLDLTVSGGWSRTEGADVYFPEFDNPATNDGVAEGLDWDEHVRLRLTLRGGPVSFQGAFSSRDKGVPAAPFGTLFNEPSAMMTDRTGYLETRYETPDARSMQVTVRLFGDLYENDGTNPDEVGPVSSRIDNKQVGGEVRFRWDPRPNHRLVLGTEGQRIFESEIGWWSGPDLLFRATEPYSVGSIFLQHEFQIGSAVSTTLGLRHDQYSSLGSATTPRAAVVVTPVASTTLKLVYGEAFRIPNVYEFAVHEPAAGIIANPALTPEKIRSIELAVEQRLSSAVLATGAVYANHMRDLIDQVLVPAPDSLAQYGPVLAQFVNRARVRAVGFEAELRAVLPGRVLGW
jgi:iron complex outermembrane receptor protein